MQSDPSFAGADSLLEGQRLLAKRRGPLRRWIREHPLGVNIVLALANVCQFLGTLFVLGALFVFATEQPEGGELAQQLDSTLYLSALLTGCVVFTAAIFFRERWSFELLFITFIVDNIATFSPLSTTLSGIAPTVFLYTMASRTPAKKGLWGFGVYCLLSALIEVISTIFPGRLTRLAMALDEPSPPDSVGIIFALGAAVALSFLYSLVVFMVGRTVHRSRMFEQAILTSFEQNKQLATTEERNRIAREMHDVVSHSLTVMIALSDGARIVLRKKPERAEEVLTELSQTGRTALADMRRTLGVLRDSQSGSAPLVPTGSGSAVENLQELVQSFASTGLPVSFTASGDDVPNDHNLRLSLYRMTQEALTNVLRYGRDMTSVEVSLEVIKPDIYLTIINDGGRFVPEHQSRVGSGKGLVGMAERAAFYRGEVDAGPNDRGGWTVRAHLLYPDTYNGDTFKERKA